MCRGFDDCRVGLPLVRFEARIATSLRSLGISVGGGIEEFFCGRKTKAVPQELIVSADREMISLDMGHSLYSTLM